MAFLSKIFNRSHTSGVKKFEPMVVKINELEAGIRALSDEQLKAKTAEFRARLGIKNSIFGGAITDGRIEPALGGVIGNTNDEPVAAGVIGQGTTSTVSVQGGENSSRQSAPTLTSGNNKLSNDSENEVVSDEELQSRINALLPEAFAVVREAARRTLGQRHFDVQLIGGMVLHSGAIAEMRTGEGKTLVATLPAYLNALSGKGVQIVTVNDYLSRRDGVWMGQIYSFLGLSVGVINHEASFLYDPEMRENPSSLAVTSGQSFKNPPSLADRSGSEIQNPPPLADRSEAPPLKRGIPSQDAALIPLFKGGARRAGDFESEKGVPEGQGISARPLEGDFVSGADILDKERDTLGAFKVVHEFLKPVTRHEAYMADITYGTNNEFGFDYLRDNLEYTPDKLRQREPNYAIVDEIDSILIDEARTPLIISAPTRDAEATYKQFANLVGQFYETEDYTVEEKHRSISLTSAGITKAEKSLGIENIYTEKGIKSVHHLETAIKAKALYHVDKEYVVKNNEIVIVDEFTGRLQPGRRWSDGLHQAIEAKEGVSIQQESRTYASITFQNFFRMYKKLAGMTGTAATSAEEFYKVYGLEVFSVPTNVPAVRLDKNDQIFRTEVGKYKAISRKVKELHDKGQPVLIGTVSIEKNEVLSQFLKAEGIPHEILNAKNHEREGEIIAQAGKVGGVTIATNMAGRGVDIKLGGNPNTPEAHEAVKASGGLFVLGTERHEARRIDNQLRGRSGRQGDPGETQFFVSLEDSLMRVFASDTLKSMMGRLGMPEDEAIEHKIISHALESAQEKIEGFNFDSRKHVLEFDDIINHQRGAIYGRRRKLLLGSIDDVEGELRLIVGNWNTANDGSEINIGDGTSSQASRNESIDLPHQTTPRKDALTSDSPRASEGDRGSGIDVYLTAIGNVINKKISEYGRETFLGAVRVILLQTIDMYWVEHLEVMDYTRSSVNLRAYGQRDPLVEYKKEGLRLFREMQAAMREQVIKILPHVVPVVNGKEVIGKSVENSAQLQEIHENAQLIGGSSNTARQGGDSVIGSPNSKSTPEIGRNDPCSCGSGKKYKKCHGRG